MFQFIALGSVSSSSPNTSPKKKEREEKKKALEMEILDHIL